MQKQIKSALISVFNKEGLEPIVRLLHELGIKIYSTGGTKKFIGDLGIPCISVEELTEYPAILGGRVKTLHPKVFGGILARRDQDADLEQLKSLGIPEIDLVLVDLYPFRETVKSEAGEQEIIEKIDIGGVSLIRAAAKNFRDVVVISSGKEYAGLERVISEQKGLTTLEQRKQWAANAFRDCAVYDLAIADYFSRPGKDPFFQVAAGPAQILRYGENPHQQGLFYGELENDFEKLHGKELSYNNLVDIDAACQLIGEFPAPTFAIIKHTNVCGIASRKNLQEAWDAALGGDKESAFGGVLICNVPLDKATAASISEVFFEVLIAVDFDPEALDILKTKKNRILLRQKHAVKPSRSFKNVLDGILVQQSDVGNYLEWKEVARPCTDTERADLEFANLVCKHLKSNAIALVKNKQLIGKGCGQTSRIDALRQALEKARQFNFDLVGAAMASDAFFPFDDSVRMAHLSGITSIIQPGGSVRDQDTTDYCRQHDLALVITGMRHFRH
ncbi:MAG TPA: bifunctional phosphoribosylaminoimidazolecarboxamide formyltransferase/IMP cyclohydrolase [Chitinophagaceae bacterium]|nr:bifunctional phosphoribosylaminoimidazolecarboxamide formyltransferase/IMP cyclohydrolase [Chitinophagaceae bacterium]